MTRRSRIFIKSATLTNRTSQRFPVKCRIYYRGQDRVGHGTVWNMSRTGWRVDGDRSVIPGDCLTLCVYLPGRKSLVLVDRAVDRCSRRNEFGLENVQVEADNVARLSRFVTRLVRSPTPDHPEKHLIQSTI